MRAYSTCPGRVPAGSKARSAGRALEAEKAPFLWHPPPLSARARTSESLPTVLRVGTPVPISTQPKGVVSPRASVLGPGTVRLSGKPHSSFVGWAPSPRPYRQ